MELSRQLDKELSDDRETFPSQKEVYLALLPRWEMLKVAEEGAARIEQVLVRSHNLKGTCIREVRDALYGSLMKAMKSLVSENESEEAYRLQAGNMRLRGQLTFLQREGRGTKETGEEVQPVDTTMLVRAEMAEALASTQRELLAHVGEVLNTHLNSRPVVQA